MTATRKGSWERWVTWLRAESVATGWPLGWLLVLLAAWHVGVTLQAGNPWHPDEHFQILEFAWARAGLASTDGLPWEYAARIRSSLPPTIALAVLRVLRAIGVESPFAWVLLLRLVTLAAAFGAMLRVIAVSAPALTSLGARRILWAAGLGAWFAPMLLSRFTSENLGGIALALATAEALGSNDRRRDWLVGFLGGVAVVMRYQMVFGVAAVWLWVLARRGRAPATRVAAMTGFVLILSLACDWWFYGEPTLTPWHYARVNLIEGVASTFGTSPWWAYFVWVPLWTLPPVGLLLAVTVLVGAVATRRQPWGWVLMAYLLPHCLVPHKELRFLFPLLYLFPPLAAVGWGFLPQWSRATAVSTIVTAQNVLLGVLLLTPSIHRGKEFDVDYLRLLWREGSATDGRALYVLTADGEPYRALDWVTNVYRHPTVVGIPWTKDRPLPAEVARAVPEGRVLTVTTSDGLPTRLGVSLVPLYSAEAGYRTVARAVGIDDWAVLRSLEQIDRWEGSAWKRRVYRLSAP